MPSRSSGGRCPSATWRIRPARTSARAPTPSLAGDPEVAADLARRPGDGHARDRPRGRLGQRRDPRLRHRPAGPRRGDRPGRVPAPARPDPSEAARIERTFEIDPETLVVAASDEVPLLIAYGTPGRGVRPTAGPVPRSAWSGPSSRSSRRWSSRSCSAGASVREPARLRGGLRGRARRPDRRVPGRLDLQRRHGAPPADRQGVVEHRRRPQAAPRPAARARVGGPRPDGVRAGRPDRRDPRPGGLRPDRADPRPGRRLGADERAPSGRCSRPSNAIPRSSRRRTWPTCRPRSSASRG